MAKIEDIIVTPDKDPAGSLAEFAAQLKFEEIPADIVEYVKKDILDAMSSIIGGSTGPAVPAVLDSMRSFNSKGDAKVLIYGDDMPAQLAAFVNGTMARAIDMGDTGVTGGHTVEWIVPTFLTYLSRPGSRKVNGKELITAFVAGAEWGAREHTSFRLQYNTKFAPGESGGSRYATVALAKLMGQNKEQIWNAAGMSMQSHAMTTQQKYNEGTPDVRLQHGFVASDAITICDLTSKGMESVHGIYMGTAGLTKMTERLHDDIYGPEFLTDGLGTKWLWIGNITNKLYGGCYYNHTPIYGILGMMKEHNIKKEDIKSIHIVTSMGCRCTTEPIEEKRLPATPEGAMFSNPYAATHAIFTGDCFMDAFKDEVFEANMANKEFVDYMQKFSYEATPEITTAFDNYPITITLNDGTVYTHTEGNLPGNQANPVSWEQVINKLNKIRRFAAVELGDAKYERLVAIFKDLENIDDCSEIVKCLIPE